MDKRQVIDDDDLFIDISTAPVVTTSPTAKKKGRPVKPKVPSVVHEVEPDVEPIDLDDVVQVQNPVTLVVSPPPVVGISLAGVADMRKMFDFRGTNLTPMQQVYVMAFATRGTRAEACSVAECTYKMVDEWMKDAEFRDVLDGAVGIVADRLEGELMRRAMDGSDRLLIRAMEAHRPEKYARRTDINANVQLSWADLAAQAAIESTKYTDVDEKGDDTDGESD